MKAGLNLSSLSLLLFNFAAVIDDGKGNTITFDDVYRELDKGSILQFLEKQFGDSVDLSLLTHTEPKWNQGPLVVEALQNAAEALRGRERRKTGIETNGVSLLIAITTEAIQQFYWDTTQIR